MCTIDNTRVHMSHSVRKYEVYQIFLEMRVVLIVHFLSHFFNQRGGGGVLIYSFFLLVKFYHGRRGLKFDCVVLTINKVASSCNLKLANNFLNDLFIISDSILISFIANC